MEKSLLFSERTKAKYHKFKENNEHNKEMKQIFRDVIRQKRMIEKEKRNIFITDKDFAKPDESNIVDTNVRTNKKHVKFIKLGSETVLIQKSQAEAENFKAIKQCQNNFLAFFNHKNKKLFPSKIGPSTSEQEE